MLGRKLIARRSSGTALTLSLCGILAIASGSSCRAATPGTDLAAAVQVNFAVTEGPLPPTYRYNNVTGPSTFPAQRAADVKFFNEQGLHGSIYRVWLDDSLYDPAKGVCECGKAATYLSQVSALSDSILVNFKASQALADHEKPAQMVHMLETVIGTLKQRFPKIDYLEAFNELDYHDRATITPAELYHYYVPFYEAVNEINAKLIPPQAPIKVGGPAFYDLDPAWMSGFLRSYAADPSREKRLDFISYHAYGYFSDPGLRDYHFYRSDPSEVATQRARLEAMLRQFGLSTSIPSFITEMGIYPGPSFTDHEGWGDALRQATGMASLTYWLVQSPKNVPFNWVLRHPVEGRKDELVTRVPTDGPAPPDEFNRVPPSSGIPTDMLTPYGNMMLMMSKMKATRVSAVSNRLEAGKGVYALASKDRTGVSILVWNYQDAGHNSFRTRIRLANLPAALRNGHPRERVFRIDDKTSDYYTDPRRGNLQQVADRTIRTGDTYAQTVELGPNALELIVIQ